MKSIVVYTAIAGNYDELKPVNSLWAEEADFVAFVEGSGASKGWERRPLARCSEDPCRDAKRYKLLSHEFFPEARYTLWIDGSIQVKSQTRLSELIPHWLGEKQLAVFPHRRRNCVYAEAVACIRAGKDQPEVIWRQMRKYWHLDYPRQNGLAECPVLVRQRNSQIRRFNEHWHEEVAAHSRRDQLSFNFVASRTGTDYAEIEGTIINNPHFFIHPHRAPPRATSATGNGATRGNAR